MTRLDLHTKPARPTTLAGKARHSKRSVEQMLYEMAYVLHLTEMVKAEIITEHEAEHLCSRTPAVELSC